MQDKEIRFERNHNPMELWDFLERLGDIINKVTLLTESAVLNSLGIIINLLRCGG